MAPADAGCTFAVPSFDPFIKHFFLASDLSIAFSLSQSLSIETEFAQSLSWASVRSFPTGNTRFSPCHIPFHWRDLCNLLLIGARDLI